MIKTSIYFAAKKIKGVMRKLKNKYLGYFEDYLIDIKIKRTNGTYRFYKSHLMHFGRFLYDNDIDDIKNISKRVTVDYLAILRNTVENSTINKRVGIIKRCFAFYGIKDHYIFTIEKFKEKKRSFEMISDIKLKRIITHIGLLDEDIGNNLLYQGIIYILINTGVRLTELYNIEKKNVNINQNEILLTKTKNGNDRFVYFRPIIKPIIKKLMKEKHQHKYLLHNRLKNRAVNYSDVNYLFKKIKKELKIRKLHAHMFRHTFATKLLQNGVDIKTVMELMGHNNLSTTQRYQHYSKEHAKKSYLEKYEY